MRIFTTLLFWSILLLGLWVRISFVQGVNIPLHSDMATFDTRAIDILTHGSFGSAGNSIDINQLGFDASTYRPPLYPLFLAGIYGLFGHSVHIVYVIQALLSALTLVGVYWLGRQLLPGTPGKATGLIAMACCAFYTPLIGYCSILLSETLFMALLVWTLLGLLLSLKHLGNKSTSPEPENLPPVSRLALPWVIGLSGIGIGLCTLTRPIGFPVCLLVMLALCCHQDSSSRRIVRRTLTISLSIGMIALLTIAPWTIRNYWELGRLVLVENSTGINMVIGNNDLATGDFTPGYETTWLYRDALAKSHNIVDLDHHLMENAFLWIRQHPQHYAALVLRRLQLYFTAENEHYSTLYQWKRIPWFLQSRDMIIRIVLQGFAILGLLIALFRRNPAAMGLGIAGFYFYIIPALCMYHTRYRHPGLPFVFLLAAFALVCLVSASQAILKKRNTKSLPSSENA